MHRNIRLSIPTPNINEITKRMSLSNPSVNNSSFLLIPEFLYIRTLILELLKYSAVNTASNKDRKITKNIPISKGDRIPIILV